MFLKSIKCLALAGTSLLAFAVGCGGGSSSTMPPEPTSPAHAPTTYYVSTSGSDSNTGLSTTAPFATIQHAADVTLPGDTVEVMAGTYANASGEDILDIKTPGTASAWITYEAYPGDTPVLSFNGWEGVFFEPSAAYIQVSGFTIAGNNYNVTLAGALAQSTTNPDPAYNGNCISADGRNGTDNGKGGGKPNHLKILNNTIYACGGAGIATAESDYLTISGNVIYDSAWYDIYGTSAISTWTDWDSNPADTTTKYKIAITGNKLYGNQEEVPWIGANPPAITDGEAIIVDTNHNTGTSLPPYTGRTLIANNLAYQTGSAAVEVFDSSHVDVVNNSSFGNVLTPAVSGRGEMNVNEASDVNVINNIFYASPGQNPAVSLTSDPTIVFDYNIYYGGTNSPLVVAGPHDLFVDPLYAKPVAGDRTKVDLSLQSASPAIGTGTASLAPATDYTGAARPSGPGTGYSRGAYQQ